MAEPNHLRPPNRSRTTRCSAPKHAKNYTSSAPKHAKHYTSSAPKHAKNYTSSAPKHAPTANKTAPKHGSSAPKYAKHYRNSAPKQPPTAPKHREELQAFRAEVTANREQDRAETRDNFNTVNRNIEKLTEQLGNHAERVAAVEGYISAVSGSPWLVARSTVTRSP